MLRSQELPLLFHRTLLGTAAHHHPGQDHLRGLRPLLAHLREMVGQPRVARKVDT